MLNSVCDTQKDPVCFLLQEATREAARVLLTMSWTKQNRSHYILLITSKSQSQPCFKSGAGGTTQESEQQIRGLLGASLKTSCHTIIDQPTPAAHSLGPPGGGTGVQRKENHQPCPQGEFDGCCSNRIQRIRCSNSRETKPRLRLAEKASQEGDLPSTQASHEGCGRQRGG